MKLQLVDSITSSSPGLYSNLSLDVSRNIACCLGFHSASCSRFTIVDDINADH
mgnify:CR=1 FL=1